MIYKILSIVILFLSFSLHVKGVNFKTIESKSELEQFSGSPLFFYFSSEFCPPCIRLEEQVFTDPEVANMINENFTPVKSHQPSEELRDALGFHGFPVIILMDKEHNEMHRMIGFQDKGILKGQLSYVAEDNQQFDKVLKRFEEGERDPDFLYKLSQMLEGARLLDSIHVRTYLEHIDPATYSTDKNIAYIYSYSLTPMTQKDQKDFGKDDVGVEIIDEWATINENGSITFNLRPEGAILDTAFKRSVHYVSIPGFNKPNKNLPVESKAFQFLLENRDKFYQQYDTTQVNLRIMVNAARCLQNAIRSGDEPLFQKALHAFEVLDLGSVRSQYILEYEYVYGSSVAHWYPYAHEYEMGFERSFKRAFYLVNGHEDSYNELMDEYINTIKDDPGLLHNMAHRYLIWYDEERLLEQAYAWAQKAHELDDSFKNKALLALFAKKMNNEEAYEQMKSNALESATNDDLETDYYKVLNK